MNLDADETTAQWDRREVLAHNQFIETKNLLRQKIRKNSFDKN